MSGVHSELNGMVSFFHHPSAGRWRVTVKNVTKLVLGPVDLSASYPSGSPPFAEAPLQFSPFLSSSFHQTLGNFASSRFDR